MPAASVRQYQRHRHLFGQAPAAVKGLPRRGRGRVRILDEVQTWRAISC